MPNYMTPGVYVEEIERGPRPIQAVGTSTAAFVGRAPNANAHVNEAVALNNWQQFVREYVPDNAASTHLSHAVYGFFLNGGRRCYVVNIGSGQSIAGGGSERSGVEVLEEIDEVAIVAAPGFSDVASYDALLTHCEKLKDRVAILDAPARVDNIDLLTRVATVQVAAPPAAASGEDASGSPPRQPPKPQGLRPRQSDRGYGAFYFPYIIVRDPLSGQQMAVPPSGHVAGVWARSDAQRGVHKAPANEALRGALNLTYRLTPDEQGELNQNGVNCIRFFLREGIRIWGARTVADGSSEWRYLNVRRLFTMIEESIAQSTRWIVFEPNDQSLWKSIRRDIRAFLTRLWRDGALMGNTPEEAFFVKCDAETNPPDVINAGMVVTLIGVAPVKPAEFIIFRISQSEGSVEIE
ncbi:phage tail sheath family protein [Candidatus Chloroploca sp. M-50]|uniref:Phage tail sheath family protein n=1 Tax=Candidatus Chloroploca mongolica TaxID=2528176 RepID=A0ABS4DA19_9CHLR|nr:phage tail sheath C-terminal domain-containing protein [Candidatus Chloroploca mongolica]MBP1466296.1 phage tail sheath family protein [Candidatus Chloroploca mongolica]